MDKPIENQNEKKQWETPDVETLEVEDGTQAGAPLGPDGGFYS